jgi:splicing factor 3B subunit 1
MLPLMDASIASVYVREVMVILIREFASPDDEMKRIVLRVVQQAVGAEGVTPQYVRDEILPEFFKNFWTRRMALEKRNYREVVDTTIHIATKVGPGQVIGRICDYLKDESEPFRKMVAETVHLVVTQLGSADVNADLEKRLIDGLIYAFQEQVGDDSKVLVDAFGSVVNSLGERMKPYLPQLAGVLKWRLNNKTPKIRQHAALLIGQIAGVMAQKCDEEKLLGHLSVVLFEYLGEEYPDVLASIISAIKAVVNVVGMERLQPPVRDLLPRLTPILRNRHEAVQENVVDLVGRIADRGGKFVVGKEWMRICYELLELLSKTFLLKFYFYFKKFLLFRGAPQRDSQSSSEHVWIYRACYWTFRRSCDASQQSQSSGQKQPNLHNRCNCNCRGTGTKTNKERKNTGFIFFY